MRPISKPSRPTSSTFLKLSAVDPSLDTLATGMVLAAVTFLNLTLQNMQKSLELSTLCGKIRVYRDSLINNLAVYSFIPQCKVFWQV